MAFDMQHWLDCVSLADSLTHRELRVLLRMSRYADYSTGNSIWPSAARLADETGIARRHLVGAKGAIATLVEKGWLVRVKEATKRTPAHYRLAIGGHSIATEVTESVTSGEVTKTVTSDDSEVTKTVTSEVTKSVTLSTQDQPKTNPMNNSGRAAPEREGDADVIDAEIIEEASKTADDEIATATRLAKHLEARIRGNGSTATYTPHWRKAIVGLLARGVRPPTIEYVIDFATADDFWSGAVFDSASFAKHYDQIAVRAQAAWRRNQPRVDDQIARWVAEHNVTDDTKELQR